MSCAALRRPLRHGVAGVVALLCLWAPAQASATTERATILSPADGSLSSSPQESPPHHTPFGGDWAVDVAGAAGRPVYARFSNVSGALSLNIVSRFEPCAAPNQGTAGVGLRVQVAVDGVSLGVVNYLHLANPHANGPIANGEQIGTMVSGTPSSCWSGPHVHVEPRNDSKYACFQATPLGTGLNGGSKLGVIGGEYASGTNQLCPPGAVDDAAGSDPRGTFDEASSPSAGTIRVRGWTFDPDAPTATGTIHVYVGGPAGAAGAEGHAFSADASRPDVGAAFPGVGDQHGLDATFETSHRGAQQVCAYAINIASGGSNVALGCKTVTVASPDPFGAYDSASSPVGGTVRVTGWSIDPNAPTQPLAMHVYVGGPAGAAGAEGHALTASVTRPDVAAAFPGSGDAHGLDAAFSTAKRGMQQICLYAINTGPGGNVGLGCKTVTIADPPPPPPVTPTPPVGAPTPSPASSPVRRTVKRSVRLARSDCSRRRLRLAGRGARITSARRLKARRCGLTIQTTAPAGRRYDLLIRRGKTTTRRRHAVSV